MRHRYLELLLLVLWFTAFACSDSEEQAADGTTRSNTESHEDAGGDPNDGLGDPNDLPGSSLRVTVPAGERAYVNLEDAAQIVVSDAQASTAWDLVVDGWNLFTNSGPNGSGDAAAFGPLDELNFLFDDEPAVPFLREDTSGAAFTDWYFYEGATHALWSRFHTYAVDDAEQLYKLQVVSYYGEAEGAPVSALYELRYALVDPNGKGKTIELRVDGTAGGPRIDDDQPSGCVDLSEQAVLMLTPAEIADDTSWDLCFRRDTISTNGGTAGPGNVRSADLQADAFAVETLDQIRELTADSELARFEAVDYAALADDDLTYLVEGPLSIFRDNWYEGEGDDIRPVRSSWLVQAADGVSRFLVVVNDIDVDAKGDRNIQFLIREARSD